jgi:serine O-acetyltransferase
MVSAGAKVLGSITIGANSKIGAGSVVLKSVPPNCTVVGVPGRVVRMKNQVVPRDDIDQIHLPDPILQDMKVLERVNTELINRMLAVEEEIRRLATEKRGAMPGDERFCESDYLREKKTIKIQPEAERDYEEIDDCVFADYI